MSKLLHIIKRELSYKDCICAIKRILNDNSKDNLVIKIDKIYSRIGLKKSCDIVASYFKKEG